MQLSHGTYLCLPIHIDLMGRRVGANIPLNHLLGTYSCNSYMNLNPIGVSIGM